MFRCYLCSIFFAKKTALITHFEDLHLVILSDMKATVVANKREFLSRPADYGKKRFSNKGLPQSSGPRTQLAANQNLPILGDAFSVRKDNLGAKSSQAVIQNESNLSKKEFQESATEAREQSKLSNDLLNLLKVECPKCKKVLKDEDGLSEHMDRFHLNTDPDEKPFMCGYCDHCFCQVP